MLRVSVRSTWLRRGRSTRLSNDFEKTAQMTETLTSSAMDAIVTYLVLRSFARPWSTYASYLLVQLSSQIAPIVKARNVVADSSCRVIASMSNAHSCMQELATIKLSAAKRASRQLMPMLEGLYLLMPTSTARLPTAPRIMPPHEEEHNEYHPVLHSLEVSTKDGAGDPLWDEMFSLT